jgi:hypothetical protein
MCEYSPSQQHFPIISHKSNNKGIVRVCTLRNPTIRFHIKINPNLSSKRFNDFVIVYIPFPEKSNGQFLSKIVIQLFKMIMRRNLRATEAH